jgi:hypothetical protein
MVSVFADHSVNHHSITGQTFVDDPGWQRRGLDSLFFASFTGPFLAFGHPDKVFSRLDIELFGTLLADHSGLVATLAADTLFRCADNDLFGPRQLRWQFLSTRMLPRRFKRLFGPNPH